MGNFCCCNSPVTCDIASDDFAADSIASGDWVADAGAWSIGGGVLTTSDVDGRLEFQTVHPDGLASHIVRVNVKADTSGDVARIWIAGDLYVELTFATSGCGTLKLFDDTVELGSTEVIGAFLDTWMTLAACYHDGDTASDSEFVGILCPAVGVGGWGPGMNLRSYSLRHLSTTAVGTQVGLATGDTVGGTISFDDFRWMRHKSDTTTDCSGCQTRCEVYNYPESIEGESFGCEWTQASGTWATETSFIGTNDTNAILLLDIKNPDLLWNQRVQMGATGLPGNIFRIYLCYTGAGDYVLLEGRISGYDPMSRTWYKDGYVRLYDGASQVHERANQIVISSSRVVFCICESGGTYTAAYEFSYSHGYPEIFGSADVTNVTGAQLALGTGGTVSPSIGGEFGLYGKGVEFSMVDFSRGYSPTVSCLSCQQPSIGCTACPGGSAPQTWTVAISGVVEVACQFCTDLNASHVVAARIVSYTGHYFGYEWRTFPSRWCQLVPKFPPYAPDTSQVALWVTKPYAGTNYYIQVLIISGKSRAIFTKAFPDTTLCSSLSGENIPFDDGYWEYAMVGFGGFYCGPSDFAGITCSVTAN